MRRIMEIYRFLNVFSIILLICSVIVNAQTSNPDLYVTTESVTDSSVILTWRTPSPGTNKYSLIIADNITGLNDTVILPGNQRKFTVSGLKQFVNYTFTLIAEDQKEGLLEFYPKNISVFEGEKYNESLPVISDNSTLPVDWWKSAVFYECFVRVFKDSNGDGKGDLKGLISKLDYLKELGIGGIWLMPVAESSDNDHGYTVSDYNSIEEDYGNLSDFQLLIKECHVRGIGIIVDFVLNHSSDRHPFFMQSASSRENAYRNWYIWENIKPGVWEIPEALPDAWHKSETGYYFGGFNSNMPEWNFRSESVRNYMKDNLKFWLNMGIDGYRFDAVHHLFENGRDGIFNQPESFNYFAELRQITDQYRNKFLVCENGSLQYINKRLFHSGFAFGFNYELITSVLQGKTNHIRDNVKYYLLKAEEGSKVALFLSNHDLFAGARPFTAFNGNTDYCKKAASLLLTLPGVPFIYYGEEIAMTSDNIYENDYALRTPMQWNTDVYSGFSETEPFRKVNENFSAFNVETQRKDENSVFNHYRELIKIRNNYTALSDGKYEDIETYNDNEILAFLRYNETDSILTVINLGNGEADYTKIMPEVKKEMIFENGGTALFRLLK